jgi:hypothetical protein
MAYTASMRPLPGSGSQRSGDRSETGAVFIVNLASQGRLGWRRPPSMFPMSRRGIGPLIVPIPRSGFVRIRRHESSVVNRAQENDGAPCRGRAWSGRRDAGSRHLRTDKGRRWTVAPLLALDQPGYGSTRARDGSCDVASGKGYLPRRKMPTPTKSFIMSPFSPPRRRDATGDSMTLRRARCD